MQGDCTVSCDKIISYQLKVNITCKKDKYRKK